MPAATAVAQEPTDHNARPALAPPPARRRAAADVVAALVRIARSRERAQGRHRRAS